MYLFSTDTIRALLILSTYSGGSIDIKQYDVKNVMKS